MIPIKLQIKNFLSYGSELQTIDFGPYNLICLSGKNGHGKSALLDAMTWAVWGEARKISGVSKADQGLLRLGQRHMVVIFDFIFNANKYRIRREFTFAYGKPYAYLEFGLLDNSDDKFIPLTDKTIRITQQKIESMIGLNYDAFCNSAFLRQGSSNEFSKKSPKDRKEILATILGLDKYESLRKVALDKIKNISIEREGIIKFQEHIEKEFVIYKDTKTNLSNFKQELETLLSRESDINNKVLLLEEDRKKHFLKKNEYQVLNFKLQELKSDKGEKSSNIILLYKEWKKLHRKTINIKDQAILKLEKEQLLNKISDFQFKFNQTLLLKEQYLQQKEKEQVILKKIQDNALAIINESKLSLERIVIKKSNIEEKIDLLKKNRDTVLQEIKKIDIIIINENYNNISKIEAQFEKRKAFYQKLISQGNWSKSELVSLEQKKKLSLDEHNPSCPLCEQNLSASRKKFLRQKLEQHEKFLKHRINRIILLIQLLKNKLVEQHSQIEVQKKFVELNKIKFKFQEELSEISKNEQMLLRDLNSYTNLIVEQNNILEQNIINNKKNIETDIEYNEVQEIISNILKKIDEISYDQTAHQALIQRLQQIESYLYNDINLSEIDLLKKQVKNEFLNTINLVKNIKNNIKNLENKILIYENLDKNELELEENLQNLSKDIKDINKHKEFLLQKIGSLENQQQKFDQLISEYSKQKATILEINQTIEEYKYISNALGKDGIQALLIEDAIPEIEQEANDLLSRLTDNQAQIFIESLRDLKKGGTKETLDIKISDGVGIRSYELFSGGEGFRIDFALRIAISKLLARRAGTSLQTLIIDEGFGSQDEEGLSNIMDAIYKIQDDFEKIIIVSHLPSMKDQFPVHFFVEKNSAGSRVKVLEQG